MDFRQMNCRKSSRRIGEALPLLYFIWGYMSNRVGICGEIGIPFVE
jgi:hypothetical protein